MESLVNGMSCEVFLIISLTLHESQVNIPNKITGWVFITKP